MYPGMMFSLAKERMESTQLWKIMKKMPKGALLHAHMDAMVEFDYLYGVLLDTPGMHIFCETALDTDIAREGAPVKFRFQVKDRGMYNSEISFLSMSNQNSGWSINLEPRICS